MNVISIDDDTYISIPHVSERVLLLIFLRMMRKQRNYCTCSER